MPDEHPKLFISYSWTSEEHESWVLNLATELRESGVDVILDKWDLKEGNDALAFMEKMVTDPEVHKVILVCDHTYSEKADGRLGGVGTETQIITPEIYKKEDQSKFVAIVAERDETGNPYLPTYYKSRKYIDLSDDTLYSINFEQLLRWVYDKPFFAKPDLGEKPNFLEDSAKISFLTTPKFRRALDAIRNTKLSWKGALREYFNTFAQNLENFRIPKETGEFDDALMENIDQFLHYRNESIEIFLALAQYCSESEMTQILHRFFEELIPYNDRPSIDSPWRETDSDNFKFIVHELFLYAIACLLKYERFEYVVDIFRSRYYVINRFGQRGTHSFSIIFNHVATLDHRNNRLKLRRLSLWSDLIKDRSKATGLQFDQLMQADFVLFIRSALDALKTDEYQRWMPVTLLYANNDEGAFEIFARAESKAYFTQIKGMFGISSPDELAPLFESFQKRASCTPLGTSKFQPKDFNGSCQSRHEIMTRLLIRRGRQA